MQIKQCIVAYNHIDNLGEIKNYQHLYERTKLAKWLQEQAAAGVADSEARAKQSAAAAFASEQRAQVAAELAEGYAEHPPVILMNGNWGIWDVQNQVYVDSGSPARGPMGPQGPAGPGTGDMLYEQYDP